MFVSIVFTSSLILALLALFFQVNGQKIYHKRIRCYLKGNDSAQKLWSQIHKFNNPNLLQEAKAIKQAHVRQGYKNATPAKETTSLIIKNTKALLDSQLTIEAMKKDFHQLAI